MHVEVGLGECEQRAHQTTLPTPAAMSVRCCIPGHEMCSAASYGIQHRGVDRRALRDDVEHTPTCGHDVVARAGGARVEHGHALELGRPVEPRDDVAGPGGDRIPLGREHHADARLVDRAHRGGQSTRRGLHAVDEGGRPPSRGTTTWHSGSPNRMLNSMSFGPSVVSMRPA